MAEQGDGDAALVPGLCQPAALAGDAAPIAAPSASAAHAAENESQACASNAEDAVAPATQTSLGPMASEVEDSIIGAENPAGGCHPLGKAANAAATVPADEGPAAPTQAAGAVGSAAVHADQSATMDNVKGSVGTGTSDQSSAGRDDSKMSEGAPAASTLPCDAARDHAVQAQAVLASENEEPAGDLLVRLAQAVEADTASSAVAEHTNCEDDLDHEQAAREFMADDGITVGAAEPPAPNTSFSTEPAAAVASVQAHCGDAAPSKPKSESVWGDVAAGSAPSQAQAESPLPAVAGTASASPPEHKIREAVNWAKEQETWFDSRMKPHDLVESKRCILHAQRNTLVQQLQELESLVRTYRERMHKCPISGRSTALEGKLEEVVKALGLGQTGLVDLSAYKVPMDKVVDLVKVAKSKEDGHWLLQLLEGVEAKGTKPWLTQFVDAGGLGALAPWLCTDASLEKGAKVTHPGTLSDSMLPQLMRLLSHIDFSQCKKGSAWLVESFTESRIMQKLQKRVADTGDEELRDLRLQLKQKVRLSLGLKGEDKKEEKKEKSREAGKGLEDSKKALDKAAAKPGADKRKGAGTEGAKVTGLNKKNSAPHVDLFGSMFGSKDKKRAAPGPPPSTIRTTSDQRVQLIDDADAADAAGMIGKHGAARSSSSERATPALERTAAKADVSKVKHEQAAAGGGRPAHAGGDGAMDTGRDSGASKPGAHVAGLGKRSLDAMQEAGAASTRPLPWAGGVDRPAPFLEKLPLLGEAKRPKTKKKRLSWADGQFSGKGSEGALKKIRVYERDPEEWNSANFLQGAGEVEALVRDSGAADTWPAPGSANAGKSVADARKFEAEEFKFKNAKDVLSRGEKDGDQEFSDLQAGGRDQGQAAAASMREAKPSAAQKRLAPKIAWRCPRVLRLSEDSKPAKLRANHIATASQQDEEVRQRRAPACNYREISLVPPDPAGTHIENQLRMPSEEDDRRISIPWDALLPPEPVHNVDPGLLAGPPPLSSTAGAGGVVAPLLQQAPAVGSYAHHLGVAAASSGGHLPGASSNGYLALHGQMNGHFPESSGYREAAAPRNVPMPQSNEQLLWAMQGTVHGYNNQNGHGADRPYASAQTPGAHGGGWMQGQAAPANVSEHSYRTPLNDKWEPDIGRGYSDSRPGPRDGGWRGSRHQRKSGGGWSSSGDRHGARR